MIQEQRQMPLGFDFGPSVVAFVDKGGSKFLQTELLTELRT